MNKKYEKMQLQQTLMLAMSLPTFANGGDNVSGRRNDLSQNVSIMTQLKRQMASEQGLNILNALNNKV